MAYTSKQIKLISPILAALLPLTIITMWLFINTQLPGNDAANYLMTAINIYHHFTEQGFFHGLLSCFTERGWRPIFFPVLAVPFLLVSHGNLYSAFSCVAILCTLASTTYIYLLFRFKLDRFSAIIATNLIGLLPLIQAQIVMFYGEAALFPCVVGGIYHLIKSDYLRNIKHVWGFVILLSLAIMLRPVEAVTHFCFIFSFFLYMGWYKGYFSPRQVFIVIAMSILALFLLFSISLLHYVHLSPVQVTDDAIINSKMARAVYYGFIGTGVFSLLIWTIIALPHSIRWCHFLLLPIKGRAKNSLLIPAIFTVFVISLVWILPFAFETLQWVYRTSLGDVASNTGSLTGAHFSLKVLKIYVWSEGVLVVIATVFIAILGIFLLSDQRRRAILLSEPFIYLLLTLPFPFWEAFYTVQIAVRKLSLAFPALLIGMLLIGLQQGRGWLLRLISIFMLLIIFFSFSIRSLFMESNQTFSSIIQNTVGLFVPRPVRMQPNPHELVMRFLSVQAEKYKLNSIALAVDPGTSDARHFVEAEPIDPFLVSTMVVANKYRYAVSYPYFSSYLADSTMSLKRKYDAIFLSDKANAMIISPDSAERYYAKYINEPNASLKVFDEVLLYYSKNQLNKIGWKLGPCIIIKSVRGGNYLGCILTRI